MKYETLREHLGDMPPLDHYPLRDYREFRWEDSEVVEFIMSHPKFMANLFDQLRKSGAIVFDADTKTWRGYRCQNLLSKPNSCCQNSLSKPDSIFTPLLSKPHTLPLGGEGMGGSFDSEQTPNPFLTADRSFDSEPETEVRDEPW